jgi:hypothetical protein
LQQWGYTRVRYYRGGLEDWAGQGWPFEALAPPARRSPGSPSPAAGAADDWAGVFIDMVERRTTGQLLQLWLGIIVVCALVYWLAAVVPRRAVLIEFGQPVGFTLGGLLKAFYFSFVTATSVGFGDVLPIGPARALAIAEAVAGLLIFGAIVSKFVSRRQERLLEETHRIAFEDRLDRVQTNLHMVLSDLQAIAAMCDEGRVPMARIRARLESAVLVFSGELRTIHDLLYRPQQTPEEPVLEGILATLAAALLELGDLLACGAPSDRTEMLTSQLAGMRRLAEGICGECVPQAYAGHLRAGMDRVKSHAARLA